MRFFLDQHMDAAVGRELRRHGHEVWSAAEAGLSDAVDDDLTVYASSKGAVVVTHDREFSQRRQRSPLGKHVWLDCRPWTAATLMAENLATMMSSLAREPDVFVHLTTSECRIHWWDLD